MSTVERDEGEEEDEATGDGEDQAEILARRRALIATALCGIAVGTEGCERIEDELGSPRACLNLSTPQPCLQIVAPAACLNVASPQPCLDMPVANGTGNDGSAAPQPVRPQPLPRPSPCLSQTRRVVVAPTAPSSDKSVLERKHDDDGGSGSET